jgi:hypothetical protein
MVLPALDIAARFRGIAGGTKVSDPTIRECGAKSVNIARPGDRTEWRQKSSEIDFVGAQIRYQISWAG